MILFPPAKINLGLHVLDKRPDGYHNIDSCMISIPVFDVLEILPSQDFQFKQSGLKIDGDLSSNLIYKAFNLMVERFQIPPVYIHIQKHIPMGAGLGGGSSNATSTLTALNQLFHLGISNQELMELSAELGSDCAFFVEGGTQISSGRGEVLSPVELHLNGMFMKVVFPGIHVSTQLAFENIDLTPNKTKVSSILEQPVDSWKMDLKNDFESSVFNQYPELKEIKQNLYLEGASYVSMSGSGSAIYALYKEEPAFSFPNYFERVFVLP